jgi:hypothetical protein
MKRSDAIIAIARQLQIPTISKEPSSYWLKYAEQALTCMETMGMLPPARQAQNLDYDRHGYINEWDEEIRPEFNKCFQNIKEGKHE